MKKSSLARCWVVGYPTIPLSGNIGRSAIFSHSNPWSLVPFSLLPIIGRVLEISRHISYRHIRPLIGTFHKILKTKESEPVPRCSWPDKALHQLTSWSACLSQQTTLPGKKYWNKRPCHKEKIFNFFEFFRVLFCETCADVADVVAPSFVWEAARVGENGLKLAGWTCDQNVTFFDIETLHCGELFADVYPG